MKPIASPIDAAMIAALLALREQGGSPPAVEKR